MTKIDYYNWSEIDIICRKLVKKIKEPFDVIVCILRGGAIPGVIIANELDIHQVLTIKALQKGQVTDAGKEKVAYKAKKGEVLVPLNKFNLKGKRILVVDDVLDSGESLKIVLDLIKKRKPKTLKVAVMQMKTYSKIKPDYYVEVKKNWLFYPWMSQRELKLMKRKLNKT